MPVDLCPTRDRFVGQQPLRLTPTEIGPQNRDFCHVLTMDQDISPVTHMLVLEEAVQFNDAVLLDRTAICKPESPFSVKFRQPEVLPIRRQVAGHDQIVVGHVLYEPLV